MRAATPRRRGIIGGADSTVVFRNAAGIAVAASGMIEIMGIDEKFSGDGDSGALVLAPDRRGLGILIAGTAKGELPGGTVGVSYALPLEHALSELGMELAL